MTIAMAWIATKRNGREDLYFAADSRTRGVRVLDLSPKILLLPRSDCALCFAGDTSATYPLMLHISIAISAHEPARERNLDISELLTHLLRVLSDTLGSVKDHTAPFEPADAQFIFGGYSWKAKAFQIWTIYFEAKENAFRARPSKNTHPRIRQIAFIGDVAKSFRSEFFKSLETQGQLVQLEPLAQLSRWLKRATINESIGGSPQVARVGPHMNSRPFCVVWGTPPTRHLFGRSLLPYEHCDFWTIDPDTGRRSPPAHFAIANSALKGG